LLLSLSIIEDTELLVYAAAEAVELLLTLLEAVVDMSGEARAAGTILVVHMQSPSKGNEDNRPFMP
jgi:hypothetical protein